MNKKFVKFIIKRYLRFDRKHPFIYISFILAFLGIMTGVATLMIAMGIMNGMDREFEKKLKVMNYPITVYTSLAKVNDSTLKLLKKHFPNFKYSPYIESNAIIKKNGLNGVMLYGVDFKKEAEINYIFKDAIKGIKKVGIFDVVVGKRLFDSTGMYKGEKIIMIFSKMTPMGFGISPLIKKVKVIGYFNSGLVAYDKGIAYMNIEGLKRILHQNYYSGIHIWTPNPFKDIEKIKKILPPGIGVVGWWQQNGNFFAALKMEKRALFLVLMLIIIVAALNIISSLLMMIMSKRKEIALMMSLGASKKEIKAIFLRLGMIIGIAGIISGAVLGGLGIWVLRTFDIIKLPADVYGVSRLPIDLSLVDFGLIIIGAFVIILLSSVYPAKKAADTDVLETLRYE
ncbi:ABC transporter permease [Caminibacter pacificus]|uniref:ABC transport system permease protein n=1 Tax=Caminibacter pacificus TaxID=1424653 RepID=A0AAJ4RDU2_9BACT|nr:ABC transporter permease [Caminibacter pacificus]QCI28374.1 ABC transporter permease [Caminibacter pacificus]ROR40903.1 putative ABC transport system permease protein [Caminibacter pacificus]